MKNPKISVVMSCYNRPDYVKEAIESVLNQTYRDFEFIIIDDCSTDNTADVVQEYANKDDRIVFIINHKNMDYNYNLRKGFEMARGEYIARMDDDDISMPERFEKQVKFLDDNPDITVLGTFIKTFGFAGAKSWITETEPESLAIAMNFYNPMCHPSVMIRKSFLRKNNLNYSPKELYAEEYHLWKEIILKGGKLANLPEQLVQYRVHPKSVTNASKTSKIQDATAERVRTHLLSRVFSEKEVKKIRKLIFKYPFENNNKKILYDVLEKMKKHPDIVAPDAIEKFQHKFCGKPCTMEIFFASDDKFTQHLCTAMASILINSLGCEKFNFYILDGGITDKNKEKIKKLKEIKDFNIEFIKVDDNLFKDCPITAECQHISKQTYYRYIIPKLKPELKKCFYFDCDIVVKDSLNEFWHTDLGDNYIAAVEELWNEAHNSYIERFKFNKTFNAGIVLINNKLWQQFNITEKLFKNTNELQKNSLIRWVDQDVLNYTFEQRVKFVLPKWNLQQTAYFNGQHSLYSEAEMQDCKNQPVIIHYSGILKPWDKECWHPLWKEYYNYLKFTPYKNKYYKYKFKKFLKEFGRVFYYKKKTPDKTKVKILGIPVYKKTDRNYTIKKYLFGIKFYKKRDNFREIRDLINWSREENIHIFNNKLSKLDAKLEDIREEVFTNIEKNARNLAGKIDNVQSNLISRIGIIQSNISSQIDFVQNSQNSMARTIAIENAKSLSVYNHHQKVFPKYKNINEGKDVVIVATGPTLNDYVPIENAVHIGVNAACLQDRVKLDYLFALDYRSIKNYTDTFINYRQNDCKKFCGKFINQLDELNIPDNVAKLANAEKYYIYYNDFNYDENFYPDISSVALPSFWSTTFQAIAFALWTNPRRLYLVGCDNNFNGHFDGTKKIITDEVYINEHIIKAGDGWKKLKQFANIHYPDTQIISINPVGLKGLFEDIYTQKKVLNK